MIGAPWLSKEGTRFDTASMRRMAQKMPIKAQNTGIRFPISCGFVLR